MSSDRAKIDATGTFTFPVNESRAAPIAAQLDAEGLPLPVWGVVETVGDMVRNLRTLDQSLPIHTAFHVDIEGKRRCRTRPVTISRERVIDGKWVDSMRKDVPYATIVWAKQDERAEQPAQSIDTPEFRVMLVDYAVAVKRNKSLPDMDAARAAIVAYIDGRTAGTAGEAVAWCVANPNGDEPAVLIYGNGAALKPGDKLYLAAPSPQSPAGGEGQA